MSIHSNHPKSSSRVPASVHAVLNTAGQPLAEQVRKPAETRFNHNFAHVRVHTDAGAAQSAKDVNATAYTVGNHVVLGDNSKISDPNLIAHELTHVVQQRNAQPGGELQIAAPEHPSEKEASQMGNQGRLGAGVPAMRAQHYVLNRQPADSTSTVQQMPVASFSPAPGLFVDRTERRLSISGNLQIFGAEATPALATTIKNTIEGMWNASFPDGFRVSCSITVTSRAASDRPAGAQIEITRIAGPSYVSGSSSNRSMVLNLNSANALTWTVAHEFGHMLGMDDRYTEGIWSTISGRFGGARTTTATPGYESNLMAVDNGTMESRNVRDLAEENAPGYFDDDDQVRNWVSRHNVTDLRLLGARAKIQMITILMGGWISDEDVSTIQRICRSIDDVSQAAAIRTAINPHLTEMSSIGQRTSVRVALAQMP